MLQGFLQGLQASCQTARVDYVQVRTDVPAGATLARYLTRRSKRTAR